MKEEIGDDMKDDIVILYKRGLFMSVNPVRFSPMVRVMKSGSVDDYRDEKTVNDSIRSWPMIRRKHYTVITGVEKEQKVDRVLNKKIHDLLGDEKSGTFGIRYSILTKGKNAILTFGSKDEWELAVYMLGYSPSMWFIPRGQTVMVGLKKDKCLTDKRSAVWTRIRKVVKAGVGAAQLKEHTHVARCYCQEGRKCRFCRTNEYNIREMEILETADKTLDLITGEWNPLFVSRGACFKDENDMWRMKAGVRRTGDVYRSNPRKGSRKAGKGGGGAGHDVRKESSVVKSLSKGF